MVVGRGGMLKPIPGGTYAVPEDLLHDLNYFGFLFENMCIRDLRIYADALDGKVYHYRDAAGLECDAVIHLRNGSYGLVEVKLGGDTLIESGAAKTVACIASSHFCSAERQYRYPLEYGGQRSPTAQWTVTGSGAALICRDGAGPCVESCTVGTVCDLGVKDANNMGAAMAPANAIIGP